MNTGRKLSKIISGGQTGVDRAALDVALKFKIPCGGWCPKERIAEDGVISLRYPLKETESSDYEVRTEWNVRDSDGTLVLNSGEVSGGTALTIEYAKQYKRHCLVVNLNKHAGNKGAEDIISFGNKLIFWGWVELNDIKILNVAGPREGKSPGIYKIAKEFLEGVFENESAG